jgi:hypothetical protein
MLPVLLNAQNISVLRKTWNCSEFVYRNSVHAFLSLLSTWFCLKCCKLFTSFFSMCICYSCRATIKKKEHPFSAARNYLFNIVAATADFWKTLCSIRNLKMDHAEKSLVVWNVCPVVLSTQSGQLKSNILIYKQISTKQQNKHNVNRILNTKTKHNSLYWYSIGI